MNQGMEPEPDSPNVRAAGKFNVQSPLPVAVGSEAVLGSSLSSSLHPWLFTSAAGSLLRAPRALRCEGPESAPGAEAAVPAAGTVGPQLWCVGAHRGVRVVPRRAAGRKASAM